MSLTDFRNGIEQHAHQMQACINTAGLHIRHEPNFSYTVGFSALGLPELVVERLPLTHAEELLRTLWNSARLANTKNRDWARLGQTLKPNPTFEPIPEDQRQRIFCDARTYYGHWDFAANAVSLPNLSA